LDFKKKKKTVSTSKIEAEYIAIIECVKKNVYGYETYCMNY